MDKLRPDPYGDDKKSVEDCREKLLVPRTDVLRKDKNPICENNECIIP